MDELILPRPEKGRFTSLMLRPPSSLMPLGKVTYHGRCISHNKKTFTDVELCGSKPFELQIRHCESSRPINSRPTSATVPYEIVSRQSHVFLSPQSIDLKLREAVLYTEQTSYFALYDNKFQEIPFRGKLPFGLVFHLVQNIISNKHWTS